MINVRETLEKHQKKSGRSLQDYTKAIKLQLGKEIKPRKKVYLDTNYWLNLMDVLLENQRNEVLTKLLDLLRKGVEEKKIICPISDEVFGEILLQTIPKTLKASAKIIDELSLGVSLLSSREREQFEILNFIYDTTGSEGSLHEQDIFVWAKISFNMGLIHPHLNYAAPDEELVIQKSIFDHLTEIAGVLDLYKPLFEEAMVYLFEQKKGFKPKIEEVENAKSGQMVANLIYHAFRKNKLGKYMPSLVIESGLHASVRQDKGRKFKKNDMPDFRHARAALPYVDYFLTENSLRDLVMRNNLSFDKKYNCKVISNPLDA